MQNTLITNAGRKMKTVFKIGTAQEVMTALSDAYTYLFWADKSKTYEICFREVQRIGTDVSFGQFGPMTDDEELTCAEVWENQQKFDNKRERAYLEPLDRSDVAGNEVQPVTLALRETRAHEWLEGDDDEVQQYQAVKRAVVFEVG